MRDAPSDDALFPAGWQDLEDRLDEFEQAWRGSVPPKLDDFYPPHRNGPEPHPAARQKFLEELVKIDLGHRWRGAAGGKSPDKPPRLEDYSSRFPELLRNGTIPADLIGEEYRVRRTWGDRPGHAEFVRRFPQAGPKLFELFRLIDAQLAAELASARPQPRDSSAGDDAIVAPGKQPELVPPVVSLPEVIDALRRLPLLTATQREEVLRPDAVKRFVHPRDLARELLQRGWLTPYQVNQLLLGRGADLVLGPYLLLERLGAGGIGQVFKARHQRLNRVVALKVIRKELVADPEIVGRFHREIQVVSRLDHPNVVHPYDAGVIGQTHFLAMEYVEGKDLNRLVKDHGPLPVAQACEYIRQAACGLAHAHDRGLVHRDIKPSNLLLSFVPGPLSLAKIGSVPETTKGQGTKDKGQIIKILDLGLARLRQPSAEQATTAMDPEHSANTLTPVGGVMMMGTPDYLAPEQAMNFHGADIRADIYSLGCTFYCLLAGQPPFAGGTVAEKLWRHQQAEPPPLEQYRGDVPPQLTAVLRKMLAKRPEDRFQKPAEVAAALADFLSSRRPQTRRRLLVAAALACAVIGVMLVLFAGPSRQPISTDKGSSVAPSEWWLRHEITVAERLPWQPVELVAALGEQRQRHWGTVHCLAVSPTGQFVASGGQDRVIRLWHPETMREQYVLGGPGMVGHAGEVLAVAFSNDGKTLASASRDASVRLWDLSGKVPRPGMLLSGHAGRVQAVAFAPSGQVLASAGDDKLVRLWDLSAKKPVPLGPELSRHTARVLTVAFSPSGQWLAAAGDDKFVRLWSVKGKEFRPGPDLAGHSARVNAIAFSSDSRWLASASDDKTLRVWDMLPAEPRMAFVSPEQSDEILAVSFAAGGKLLATAGPDRTVRLWTWDGTKASERFPPLLGHNQLVTGLAFFPDGRKLASAGQDSTVRLWASDRHQEATRLQGYPCTINAAEFDRGSERLAAVTPEGMAIAWEFLRDGKETWFKSGIRGNVSGLALAGQTIAVGSHRRIALSDLVEKEAKPGPAFSAHEHFVYALAFAPGGKQLATGGHDMAVRLWNLHGPSPSPVGPGREHPPDVRAVAFAPDGRWLASASSSRTKKDGTVRLWHVRPDGLTQAHEVPGQGPLVFSADGKLLVGAGLDDFRSGQIWDVSDSKLKERALFTAKTRSAVTAVAISPNGGTVACATDDGLVVCWDLASERPIHTWDLPGLVRGLAFTPDGRHLLTANVNNTVYVLRLGK